MAITPSIPFHLDPNDFSIVTLPDGSRVARSSRMELHVIPTSSRKEDVERARIVMRRTIRMSTPPVYETVLLGELNGVKLYLRRNQLFLTDKELSF